MTAIAVWTVCVKERGWTLGSMTLRQGQTFKRQDYVLIKSGRKADYVLIKSGRKAVSIMVVGCLGEAEWRAWC